MLDVASGSPLAEAGTDAIAAGVTLLKERVTGVVNLSRFPGLPAPLAIDLIHGAGWMTAVAEDEIEMCSVRVGGTLFGVPIMRILEILGAPATQPVPLAPSYIGGLVHYRGEILSTVSLRSLLDMPALSQPPDMLVFEGADGYFGLLVDAVGEVMTVLPQEFAANPSTLDDHRKALFAGTYKLNDGLLVMLDPGRFDPMQLSQ